MGNVKGTAILVPGQYRGAYKIGFHKGKYKALVQAKPVKLYIDNDKDNKYRKPNIGMLESLFRKHLQSKTPLPQISNEDCLMIGDASGKEGQLSDSDKKTAENFGIDYIDVEDFCKVVMKEIRFSLPTKWKDVRDFSYYRGFTKRARHNNQVLANLMEKICGEINSERWANDISNNMKSELTHDIKEIFALARMKLK